MCALHGLLNLLIFDIMHNFVIIIMLWKQWFYPSPQVGDIQFPMLFPKFLRTPMDKFQRRRSSDCHTPNHLESAWVLSFKFYFIYWNSMFKSVADEINKPKRTIFEVCMVHCTVHLFKIVNFYGLKDLSILYYITTKFTRPQCSLTRCHWYLDGMP
jgi:hypothetical protein